MPKKALAPQAGATPAHPNDGFHKAAEFVMLCEACRLEVYDDGSGYATQGHGNRYRPDGSKVRFGDPPIDQATADKWFMFAFKKVWQRCEREIPGWESMHSGQRAAITDLAYNDNYQYKDGDHDSLDAALDAGKPFWNILLKYKKANGKPLLGLGRRRLAAAYMAKDENLGPVVAKNKAWAINSIEEVEQAII